MSVQDKRHVNHRRVKRPFSSQASAMAVTLGIAAMAHPSIAQEVRQSIAGESAATSKRQGSIPKDYNIRMGSVGLRSELQLGLEYNDNIFWRSRPRESDFIIKPEVRLRMHWQASKVNALTFGVGIGYDYYVDHDELNSDRPLISPDSAIAFNLYSGDFKFNFHDRFYYQESISYGSYVYDNRMFYNVGNIGILGRYDNMAGLQVDWDLNELILTFNYDHEEFWVTDSKYSYLDRSSEWLKAMASFLFSPQIQAGVEGHFNFHNYHENQYPDFWRAGGGPFIAWSLSPHLNFRIGAGYETQSSDDVTFKSSVFDNWYAYGQVNHRLNRYMTHSLMAGHRNELGFNGYNITQTYFQYNANLAIFRNVDVGVFGWLFIAEEGGKTFEEEYIYWSAGCNLGYQISERWRSTLAYIYTEKFSDIDYREFYRNQVRLSLLYRF